ncbi:hypothetical protein C9374_007002 [Naegleria lovaniensis]|uniref:RGS domain-containing protein n=1 Tax=Naegleria lovaniensis TaxID=51637 RepID=A0AA88KRP5_NAELO|nr:uncharacterized protein C9374_007002 [Naegleria lovaniensis]KAG2393471.1 hypothetical protein C9374_007002 [Naegleria lovaniensis]
MGKKKRYVQSCDLECYNFNYESIYNEKECKDCFWEYLLCTHNEEALYFIQKVQQFKRKDVTSKQKAKLAIEIYHDFIKDGGKYELNLSSKDKQSIQDEFQKSDQLNHSDTCTINENIFNSLEQTIHLSLKEATFPHFVKSPKFREFALQQTCDFLDKIGYRSNVKKIDIIQQLNATSILTSPSASSTSFSLMDDVSLHSSQGTFENFFESTTTQTSMNGSKLLLLFEENSIDQGWKLFDKQSHITMDDFRFMARKLLGKDSKMADDIGKFISKTMGNTSVTPSVNKSYDGERSKSLSAPSTAHSSQLLRSNSDRLPSLSLRKGSIESSTSSSVSVVEYFEDIWKKVEKRPSTNTLLTNYEIKSQASEEHDTEMLESLKNIHIFKTEMEFPYHVKFVVETLAKGQYRIQFDDMLKESFSLDFCHLHNPPTEEEVRKEACASAMLQEVWKFSSFGLLNLKDRSFIVEASMIHDIPNNAYLLLKKSVDNVIIDDSDCVRGRLLQLQVFQHATKDKTTFSDFVVLDMKDSCNPLIFESCVSKRAKNLYEKGLAALKTNMDLHTKHFATPGDSDRILETLTSNEKIGHCSLGFKLRSDHSSSLDRDLDMITTFQSLK